MSLRSSTNYLLSYVRLLHYHQHLVSNESGMHDLSDVGANKDVGSLIPTEVTTSSSWSDTAGQSYADEFPKLPNEGETEAVPDPLDWMLVTRHRPSSPKKSLPKKSAVTKQTLRLCGSRVSAYDDLRRDFDRPNTFAVRFSLVQVGSLWSHARSKSRSVHFGSIWRLLT